MKTLVCPHCATQVSEHVSVCAGCGAEVIRGATRGERSLGGLILAGVAFVISAAVIGLTQKESVSAESGLPLFGFQLTLVLTSYVLGAWLTRFIRRKKIRFMRVYQHR